MKKLIFAFGIIVLFLGNSAFATGLETSNSGEANNSNLSLGIAAKAKIDEINAAMSKKINDANSMTDPGQIISVLESHIKYMDSSRAEVQVLRAKIVNSNLLIQGEKNRILKDKRMSGKEKRKALKDLNYALKKNKRMIPRLTDMDDKLQVASDDLKAQVKHVRAYITKNK